MHLCHLLYILAKETIYPSAGLIKFSTEFEAKM